MDVSEEGRSGEPGLLHHLSLGMATQTRGIERVRAIAHARPYALFIAILADHGGAALTDEIKTAARPYVENVNVWWTRAKRDARGAGWVNFRRPASWTVRQWPEAEDMAWIELPPTRTPTPRSVRQRDLSDTEVLTLRMLSELTGMTKREAQWARQKIKSSPTERSRSQILADVAGQENLSSSMASIHDPIWRAELVQGVLEAMLSIALKSGAEHAERPSDLEHLTRSAETAVASIRRYGIDGNVRGPAREQTIGVVRALANQDAPNLPLIKAISEILGATLDAATAVSLAATPNLPQHVVNNAVRAALASGSTTAHETIGMAIRDQDSRAIARLVLAVNNTGADGYDAMVRCVREIPEQVAASAALETLLDAGAIDITELPAVGALAAAFLSDKHGEARFANWLDKNSGVSGVSDVISLTLQRAVSAKSRHETEQIARDLVDERAAAAEVLARYEQLQRVHSELEHRFRELQARMQAESPNSSAQIRSTLVVLASIAQSMDDVQLPAGVKLKLEAALAQLRIERVGSPGEVLGWRAELFDFLGPLVAEGSPAVTLRSAWIARDGNSRTLLVRGVMKATSDV